MLRAIITFLKSFRQAKKGVSNVIVVMLSLILIVIIVSNVILWSYQMNQFDWEKMQEKIDVLNVERATSSSWFTSKGEYTVEVGSHLGGMYKDTWTVNDVGETFQESTGITPPQTLYAHKETTNIGGTSYYLLKTTSADNSGITLSQSIASTERKLFGRFVYSLTGVTSIPSSMWTFHYRAWRDPNPQITYDASVAYSGTVAATTHSWTHTVGDRPSRIVLVGVTISPETGSPTTISSITFSGTPMILISSALYSNTNPQVRTYLYYLVNPPAGPQTVSVTLAESSTLVGGSLTLYNVDTLTPIQTQNTAIGSGITQSCSVTLTGSGCWLVGTMGAHRTATPRAWTLTEGSGQTQRWYSSTTVQYRSAGSTKPVDEGTRSLSWTTSRAVNYAIVLAVINPVNPSVHVDVDILIRRSDGTVRQILATDVANSADLLTSASTFSATYSWALYTVVDQTDYLEIAFFADVIAPASINAYLIVDDNTLAPSDQTRIANIMFPSENNYTLELSGEFILDLAIYPLEYIKSIEIQVRYKASDSSEKWFLKAYNWTSGEYSDIGFNSTAGHLPTTEFDYYTVNLTDKWQSYVQSNGLLKIKLCDELPDENQTVINIDFLGVRTIIDGASFSFRNSGAITVHIVSIWTINATYHKRYDANFFINSGEDAAYIRADVSLPAGNFTVKVVTERGSIAVFTNI